MLKQNAALPYEEPDASLLDALLHVRLGCLAAVTLIGAVVLAAWAFPALGRILPDGWQAMKAESAIAAL